MILPYSMADRLIASQQYNTIIDQDEIVQPPNNPTSRSSRLLLALLRTGLHNEHYAS